MNSQLRDEKYMKVALELAQKADGRTSPNPLVGAVIVKGEKVIGRGYHQYAGGPHAEINALKDADRQAQGANLYVTLEPCSHYGKTPPCTQAILDSGIKRVFIGMEDPNPRVSGRGIQLLKENGVEVEVGILEEKAKKINEVFIKYITTKRPYIILKNGITLDGKIATKTGHSKWITGEESRFLVHKLRDKVDGILVGIGTVLSDDPRLTTRLPEGGKDPVRVILDGRLRVPLDAKVIKNDSEDKVIVATLKGNDKNKIKKLEQLGVKVIEVSKGPRVDLKELLKKLGELEITSVLVEGGSEINASFLNGGFVDKLYYFIAPKIIGGSDSIPVVGGVGVEKINNGIQIVDKEVKLVGDDILLIGYPKTRGIEEF
ncbi:bifunctional diaminohydroxyphosphoribosylaminopyrimidine deaminase/5-amino-6-(5-phosphoribosylamino)uracil reductase RibD [Halonatronum saccharophilum]|uniref:bifunctional diaminohydroxyphosphoribosylaminopyrimidine deaminase/5-amino-6-(5-phosphoribosylamino)uracil reductase RibD n=1 Tax=Halonatronum saccharophilum TaxID=150060 RepID=UPI0004844890|nr:bifunctional diaminohydroxyphosphoribosylaminopyrimidine deaminase/5-amino-6-(5-phosphoribosylamino)uracil reductase RibD [Halonatronum saccharophilum]